MGTYLSVAAPERKGSSAPSCSRARKKVNSDAREVEDAQRLDKLPQEMWDKILDDLESEDLFPLALSCRYFRQKQKELVERARESKPVSGKPPLTLRTVLRWRVRKGQPASAGYLRFCRKEEVPENIRRQKAELVRRWAAYHGHLPLLQELQADWESFGVFIAAAAGTSFSSQSFLLPLHLASDSFLSFSSSQAEGGQLETLKWLRSEGCPWDARACKGAAYGGHLDVLKWLRSEGCPGNARACRRAALGGHFEILRWLRSEGCPCDAEACHLAVNGGHLEVLKWLRSKGCPCDKRACYFAAGGGHFEMLKWLRSESCYWDENTCSSAAKGGHLDMLQWAIDNGCPYKVNYYTRPALESLGLA